MTKKCGPTYLGCGQITVPGEVAAELSGQPGLALSSPDGQRSALPLPLAKVKALGLRVEPNITPGTTLGEALRGIFGGNENGESQED